MLLLCASFYPIKCLQIDKIVVCTRSSPVPSSKKFNPPPPCMKCKIALRVYEPLAAFMEWLAMSVVPKLWVATPFEVAYNLLEIAKSCLPAGTFAGQMGVAL